MRINTAVRKFLVRIGGIGGASTSRAKVRASRRNGKLGGRPRKIQARG